MLKRFSFLTPPKAQKIDEESELEPEIPDVVQSSRPVTEIPSRNGPGGPGRPLRLVYLDERGNFKMDPEAVAALHRVKGPLGVVAVCGRARQGKSFILNQGKAFEHTCMPTLPLLDVVAGTEQWLCCCAHPQALHQGFMDVECSLKRTAPDGSEYSLLLLDSEGIDAYDQTGTYSTQIFSLAVLLSSMFVYNQMGGIDEAALDKLSLVTEMTKHIRVRASTPSQGASASEIGQFSPLFLWLLRDFYLDLTEDGRRITPRDYLESALQPIPGSGRSITSKNEIRNSIRALFPERDCFTLVRPLHEEKELQKLDQIPMEKMRPEFKAGLDALTKYIFERTRPKQLGSIVMTGPMFAGLTQSFLDAINAGAVPTIATSWQNVEENECRRAYDMAVQAYGGAFPKQTPPDEVLLQKAQEDAVQAALDVYNSEAVGTGPVRKKYEKQLHTTLKRHFEDFKRRTFMEAELNCLKEVGSMEERLRNACNAPNATYDSIVKLSDAMVAEYEAKVSGSLKYQKLVKFLQKSLAGPIHDLVKRASDKAASDYSSLELKGRSMEERLAFSVKQTEAAQRDAQDWKKRYENIMSDYNRATESSTTQHATLQKKVSSLEERRLSLTTQVESAKVEAGNWQSKYEQLLSARRAEEERLKSDVASLQNRCSTAEARLTAVKEQSESAKAEAIEWQRKHDAVAAGTKAALERANGQKERAVKQSQLREDTLRAEYALTLSQKDQEVKELKAKLEQEERQIIGLTTRLQEFESKASSQSENMGNLRSEVRTLQQELEHAKTASARLERDLEKAQRDKALAEQRMDEAARRMEEAERKQAVGERNARLALEAAEKARAEATAEEKQKLETQRLAAERLAAIERIQRRCESMELERDELTQDLEQLRITEKDAISRVTLLERRLEEREQEMEVLLNSSQEQRAKTVEGFESLLASERAAKAEANQRAESLSLQIQTLRGQLDVLQAQLATVRNHDSALETRVRTFGETHTPPGYQTPSNPARNKRPYQEAGIENSPQEMDIDARGSKKSKMEWQFANSSSMYTGGLEGEEGGSGATSTEVVKESEPTNYKRFTIAKLKQKLTEAGFGMEVLQARNPNKKELVGLYEKLILNKPPVQPPQQ